MRLYLPTLALLISSLLCTSFTGDAILVNTYWVYQKYNDNNQSYSYRTDSKFRDVMGFMFLPDGNAKIRQNVSWCGTTAPNAKIAFETVDGKWSLTSDSILMIEHLQFGIADTLRLKIIELSENQLIVKYSN